MKLNLLLMLVLAPLAINANDIADVNVEHLSIQDERTIDVFAELARKAHIVIGISGEIVDSDNNKRISVDSDGKTLRNILDDICSKDSRFSWKLFDNNGINVTMGMHSPSLIDVRINRVSIHDAGSEELIAIFLHMPEIKKWAASTKCSIGRRVVIVGNSPRRNTSKINLEIDNEPFWKVLNAISTQTGAYFWSAVKYPGSHCTINLQPPDDY